MNYFFSWRKELNIKKVIIAVFIILVLLILILSFGISKFKNHKLEKQKIAEENAKTTKEYISLDNSISIELSKSYKLVQNVSSSEYLLDLISDSNLCIHISKVDPIENKNFQDITKADRLAFSQSFETCSNLSELKELLVGDKSAYTYSFHYLDKNLNKAFFIQIIWIEINNLYYTIDIDFPLDDLPFYTNLVTETLSSFKKL